MHDSLQCISRSSLVYTCFRRVSVNQTAKLARFSLCCACSGDSDCHGMSARNLKVMVCP